MSRSRRAVRGGVGAAAAITSPLVVCWPGSYRDRGTHPCTAEWPVRERAHSVVFSAQIRVSYFRSAEIRGNPRLVFQIAEIRGNPRLVFQIRANPRKSASRVTDPRVRIQLTAQLQLQ
jgi:hypothetical protein